MSFLENLGFKQQLKEEEKIKTLEDSEKLIVNYLEEYEDIVDFKNHKKFSKFKDRKSMYRFTCKFLSLKFLSDLSADRRVKNVLFTPSQPPPGGAIDGISMRYKVYIEYHS
jgi:hypothetical protein